MGKSALLENVEIFVAAKCLAVAGLRDQFWNRGIAFGFRWIDNIFVGRSKDRPRCLDRKFVCRTTGDSIPGTCHSSLVEEVIYRGMLYPAIQRLLGMSWAIVVVSVMFA